MVNQAHVRHIAIVTACRDLPRGYPDLSCQDSACQSSIATPSEMQAPAVSRRRLPYCGSRLDQFNWQLAGLVEVNSALVPHSG